LPDTVRARGGSVTCGLHPGTRRHGLRGGRGVARQCPLPNAMRETPGRPTGTFRGCALAIFADPELDHNRRGAVKTAAPSKLRVP
jgi:hypothetical protein